jgi:transcriptional regulator with XRE-family HTH domain
LSRTLNASLSALEAGELTVGAWMRERRKSAGKGLREVAAAMGVSHVFVGEVERGKHMPFKRVAAWAAAVGILVGTAQYAMSFRACSRCGRTGAR